MTGISIGTQLVAPDGFLALECQVTYYFLRYSVESGRVLLVEFKERSPVQTAHKAGKRATKDVRLPPLPRLVALAGADFERGLRRRLIVQCDCQRMLPPWLSELEGKNLQAYEQRRHGAAMTHRDRVDAKLDAIAQLVQRYELILDANDPDREVNRHARSLTPKLNETRVRLWFYLYIAFNRNWVALYYPIQRIGKWDRLNTKGEVKRGRPGYLGKEHGHNTDAQMVDKMLAGYRSQCGLGVSMSRIYSEVMRSSRFGCKTRLVREGRHEHLELFHPQGHSFPSKKTFVYHVLKAIGTRAVQETLYGAVKVRSKLLPYRGAFTEHTWNLMQRVETDAQARSELPRGYVEGSPLRPLYVVVRRDTASGAKTGIGFSQGAETAVAYRMAKFCEAVDKVKFCSLFGVSIRSEQWPSQGIAPSDVQDRGAGATSGARSRDKRFEPVVRELSPSHSGQSKAIVESSHEKTMHNTEAPNYIQSKLRSIELARKAIFDVLRFNESCNVSDRIPPDLAGAVARPTPNALWNTFASLGRNDAVQMQFDDAVRAFLEPVKAKLSRAGIELAGRRYSSGALAHAGAFDTIKGSDALPVEVYVLEACVRHVWLEWNGRLIELDVRYPIAVKDEVLYMSMAEALQYESFCADRDRKHAKHRQAVAAQLADLYEEQTGLDWNSAVRKSGRPKRGTAVARREGAEARNATLGKKAA